jgi:hypothetical protein
MELLLMQDKQVIETLAPHTPKKTLTDGIRARGEIRSFENLDATRLRNPSETHSKLAIVITDEVLWPHAIGGGDPSLLCDPSVGGTSCDAHMDHLPRVQVDHVFLDRAFAHANTQFEQFAPDPFRSEDDDSASPFP